MKKTIKILLWLVLLIFLAVGLKILTKKAVQIAYPLKYETFISASAEKYGLDKYLVMAVIKAESNYIPTAHSGVARGLMQITDDTALWLTNKMGIKYENFDIENPALNIEMGCYYLRYLSNLYGDRTVILASYNAGMGNVSKWLNDERCSTDSHTLVYIPFTETRNYVEKVNKYESIYKKLYPNTK